MTSLISDLTPTVGYVRDVPELIGIADGDCRKGHFIWIFHVDIGQHWILSVVTDLHIQLVHQ